MADPLCGCDTYDILAGIGEPNLCQRMKAWGRMDDIDAAQVEWEETARKLLVDGSYEIMRLNKINEELSLKVRSVVRMVDERLDKIIEAKNG